MDRSTTCYARSTSPEIWLDLQSDYDLQLARRTTWKQIEPRVRTRVA